MVGPAEGAVQAWRRDRCAIVLAGGVDPPPLTNLANLPAHRATVVRLNRMVNALVAREVGRDDGSEYPGPTELYNQVG